MKIIRLIFFISTLSAFGTFLWIRYGNLFDGDLIFFLGLISFLSLIFISIKIYVADKNLRGVKVEWALFLSLLVLAILLVKFS